MVCPVLLLISLLIERWDCRKIDFLRRGDVEGLAEKIREFIDRPLSEEEKRRQIRMMAEQYDWGRIADETLGVYREVVG